MRDDDRQTSPRKVERDFVDFDKALVNTEDLMDIDVLQHGDVEQVFQARLEVAVEIGVLQDSL